MSKWNLIIRKIKTFAGAPVSAKLLFIEAAVLSAYVKTTLLFLPFRRIAGWLGKPQQELNKGWTESETLQMAEKIRFAIKLCDRYTPWPTECYTRALTAKIMLNRRKVNGTLFFGFHRDESGEMKGHAWLKSCGIIVTGFCDFSKYEIHSAFS